MRIALGGFAAECCTFSPLPTRLEDFRILRGPEILGRYPFLDSFDSVDFVLLLHARALPGGPVEPEAYRAIRDEIVERLASDGPWDGVYLDMHGAAFVRSMEDAEGDFLRSVRAAGGPDTLVAASYDLHGNLSGGAADALDILTAYRTAPHADEEETRRRAVELLARCLRRRIRPVLARVSVPVLLPGEKTSTEWEPGARLWGLLSRVSVREGILDASILAGYPWADEPRAGASVVVVGTDAATAGREAYALAREFWDAREEFDFGGPAGSIDECLDRALACGDRPVFISDSGDNPTAGGAGDVTAGLRKLLERSVPHALFASITDEAATALCHERGIGGDVRVGLGGKLDPAHGPPLPVGGRVKSIATITGEEGRGLFPGRQAVIESGGTEIIVTERRTPFHRIDQFRRLGIEPAERSLVVVKIGYLEPELKAAAARSYLALTAGAVDQNLLRLPFRRLRRPLFPLDRDFEWAPEGASPPGGAPNP
ncbi:MAG: M81 family metallopeptidase [Candidatus Eisenbacteria bacterium]